jgi:hypothetical protein
MNEITEKGYKNAGYFFIALFSLLIRFINERYKTGVSEGDFKSIKEIIDYILDKESSL